jgi:myo-inositol-1(or 4)-monophosphatase
LRESDRDAESDRARAALARGLEAAVREAGELARQAFGKPVKTWLKDESSPVSEVDIAVNVLLRQRLTVIAPDAGWLSEETEDDLVRLEAPTVWIVDPIDGTRAFIAGIPEWTVSVALVEAGRPVVAALHAPATDEFFLAVAGTGTTRNGAPVTATLGATLAGARVAGPKVHLERLARAVPGLVAAPRVHSLALRLARVADGTIDAAIAGRNSRDWDLAAADLLVHEAGGALTTTGGIQPAYNRATTVHGVLVAAGRARHRELMALLDEQDVQPP